MRIALIDTHKRAAIYPIALLKIAAWRKSLGDKCELFSDRLPLPGDLFDEIWMTTLFTHEIPHVRGMIKVAKTRAKVVRVGGVAATLLPEYFKRDGVIIHRGLIDEAEECSPDYSILGTAPQYGITHTSRGCVRKCGFCMVRTLEPKFTDRPRWVDDIPSGVKQVLFYDNNWLAKPTKLLQRDVDTIRELQKGEIESVDFNQGLDCRLLSDKKADMLKDIRLSPVRFAFDWMKEDEYYQKAVTKMHARGCKEFITYVLYNFEDTLEEFYYRIRTSAELAYKLRVDVKSFPMRYSPIDRINTKRMYVGKHWTQRNISNFKHLLTGHSPMQVIACTPSRYGDYDEEAIRGLHEFEYWFGKDAGEFRSILNADPAKIKVVAGKRRAHIRLRRAKVRMKIQREKSQKQVVAKVAS